ncbi:MAG: response regulator [Alphaproteobacteria bacterium]|nr:response regulator [Alphaproteobacteria bacterium]MBV9554903.1 response regulator [Alphaproteobacteria bacterium]
MASVLVIDDDPVIREVVQRILDADGISVSTVGDAQTGLSRYAEEKSDLVIVDILMPGKEGIATILELREADPDARILAMTGGGNFGAPELLRIAELLGADNTLRKPFAPSELRAAVQRCLAASSAET